MPEAPADPLRRLVEDYLRSCRARGLAPKTVGSAYAYPLRSVFLPWAARAGLDRLESIAPRALETLAAELLDPERVHGRGPLSRYTVHGYPLCGLSTSVYAGDVRKESQFQTGQRHPSPLGPRACPRSSTVLTSSVWNT